MTSCKVWNYSGTRGHRPETFRCKDCLPRRFRSPRKEDPGKNIFSATERLWSNLTGIQAFHCQLSSSQTHPDCSQNSWQPSWDPVSVLCSLVSCILPWLLSLRGCHYSRVLHHLCNTAWLTCQRSDVWKENGIGRLPDHFPLCGKRMVWEWDYFH